MVHSQPLKIGLGENAIPHLSMSSDFENLSLQNRNIKAKQKRQYSQSLDLNWTRVSEVIWYNFDFTFTFNYLHTFWIAFEDITHFEPTYALVISTRCSINITDQKSLLNTFSDVSVFPIRRLGPYHIRGNWFLKHTMNMYNWKRQKSETRLADQRIQQGSQ